MWLFLWFFSPSSFEVAHISFPTTFCLKLSHTILEALSIFFECDRHLTIKSLFMVFCFFLFDSWHAYTIIKNCCWPTLSFISYVHYCFSHFSFIIHTIHVSTDSTDVQCFPVIEILLPKIMSSNENLLCHLRWHKENHAFRKNKLYWFRQN